jgi:pimeloyl-ACP methyl ester carboxylesterase
MEPPEWFTTALACLPEERIVDGIHVLHWRGGQPPAPPGPRLGQSPPRPTIVLLHGSGANCHWYSFVAPLLLDAYDVVAISNSGNGRSEWCDTYSPRSWADEVVMVLERLHLLSCRGSTAATTVAAGPCYLAAHSFGAYVGVEVAARLGRRLDGLILIDAMLRDVAGAATMRQTTYLQAKPPWREDLLVRPPSMPPTMAFRLMPPQPCSNRYIVDYIAEQSAAPLSPKGGGEGGGEGGWAYTADPNRNHKLNLLECCFLDADTMLAIHRHACPVAWVYGKQSVIVKGGGSDEYARETLQGVVPIVGIDGAAHHVWLDQVRRGGGGRLGEGRLGGGSGRGEGRGGGVGGGGARARASRERG